MLERIKALAGGLFIFAMFVLVGTLERAMM